MKINPSVARLGIVAAGVFGFAASLTASAGFRDCSHCLPAYHACVQSGNPDPQPSCLEQFWDCERAGGCPISFPIDP